MDFYRGMRNDEDAHPALVPDDAVGVTSAGRPAGAAAQPPAAARIVTAGLFALALALQLAAPLLRDRVPLSDALFIDSVGIPVWTAVLLGLLALVLWLATRRGDSWSSSRRIVWGVAVAVVVGLLHAGAAAALAGGMPVQTMSPVEVGLLWAVPAALWIGPAAVLLVGWARSRWRVARPLAYALVLLGVMNFPFILWLTRLWAVYVNVPAGA